MNEPTRMPTHHVLTVDLEDYFQAQAFRKIIDPDSWYRFESRLSVGVAEVLRLLEEHRAGATFFASGWVADQFPEIIRDVSDRGHEVASAGYLPRAVGRMGPSELRDDLSRAREAIERASGRQVIGYRNPHGLNTTADLWALEVLAGEGFAYDSSLRPHTRQFDHEPWRRRPHLQVKGDLRIWEVPLSVGDRQLHVAPAWQTRRALARLAREQPGAFVINVHTWELDPGQPRITALPMLSRRAHYRNLERMAAIVESLLGAYSFQGIASHLGLDLPPRERAGDAVHCTSPLVSSSKPAVKRRSGAPAPIPATIVVPCYNEELGLRYLANTLESVRNKLEARFDLRLIFVDDGSSDDTWRTLGEVFGDWRDVSFARHDHNRGVAAAIFTGIERASTEIVCSIDCDCTYDPHELEGMIPLLDEGVDLVTASPYHPRGAVANVPPWRLLLSKTASCLYRHVLRRDIWTFTSCFRVYRRSAVVGLDLTHPGFLGVAELLGRLALQGSRIVEYPATLKVRVFGRSKMKVARTVVAHFGLLARLLRLRIERGVPPGPSVRLACQPRTDPTVELDY